MQLIEFRPAAKKSVLATAVASAWLLLAAQSSYASAPPSVTIAANLTAPYDVATGNAYSEILLLGGYTISGNTATGAVTNEGSIVSLINRGLFINGYGVLNTGSMDNLDNQATIIGSQSSGVYNEATGSIGDLGNENNSTITGNHTGIRNTGSISFIGNLGLIHGTTFAGIDASTGSIGTLRNYGVIEGGQYGIYNGTVGSATGTIGLIDNETSGPNAGTITGGNFGIYNTGTITAIDNAGTISGATAIYNSGTIGAIANSGTIDGNIVNDSSHALTISGGTGTTFGALVNGMISSTAADLSFGTGNVRLADTIDVGSQTVRNVGAVLEVDAPVAITGNYYQYAGATLLSGVTDSAVTTGASSDSGYGRLIVSGDTTIEANSSVQLKSTTGNYAFAAGQRFVVVDTAGTANYNAASLQYSLASAAGTLTATGASVTSGTHTDLVVTIADSTATTGTGTGTGTGTTTGTGTGTGTGTTTGTDTGMTTTPSTPPALLVPTRQQARQAYAGLLRYTGVSDAKLLNLYDAAIALSTYGTIADVNRAGAQLAPISQAATARAAAAPTYGVLDVISTHLQGLRLADNEGVGSGSGVSTGEGALPNGLWGQAFGGHASQDERNEVDGYSANFGGLMVGMDRAIGDAWRAGGVFSYSTAAINNTGSTAGDTTRVNSYGLMAYGSYTASRWYANVSGGAVLQHYDEQRQIAFDGYSGNANGSFSGTEYVVRAELGAPLAAGAYTVTPLAALTYSYLHQNGYTETGGNGAALTVGSANTASVKSDLGAKLSRDFATSYGVVVPELTLAWRHEYDRSRTSTAASYAADPSGLTSFTSVGASPVSDLAAAIVGVTLLRASNLSVTARYEVEAGKGYVSQAGTLKLRQLF
ncbi:autotransporter outer membrane beta-barrel domain-containing protein [Paraburkholderia heleia]|uniref:autotransporter outer membrane beta-barrel domain-containing protein n=1 Tax=Paraburkholderia heleia TaxID=634127 RepID=UPI001427D50B|nr:autotransporter domain-containing protein [Paraburkholderia heleia]